MHDDPTATEPSRPAPCAREAEALATSLLADVGTRLAHTRAVAAHAATARGVVAEPWRSALEPAAWLHDIGYAPKIATIRFHPLDGARYLVDRGWAPEICSLVAWHTSAGEEARLRRLDHRLTEEFDEPDWLALAALSWADLTSSPVGETTSAPERIAEVLTRYEPGTVVHQAMARARPALLEMASVIDIALGLIDAVDERAAS